jgi:A1 cistron-splicing factor AAR2
MEAEVDLEVLGGTIVVLDMPRGSAVGLDQYVYTVGDNFRGVKHVPPGTHVLSYAAHGGEGAGFGPVTAAFVVMPTVELSGVEPEYLPQDMDGWMKMSAMYGPVLCWRWDAREEVLRKVEEEDGKRRIEQAVRGFALDRGLGSYLTMNRLISNSYCMSRIVVPSWSGHKEWMGLSKFVTDKVLDRVAPIGGNVCILAEEEYVVMERSDRNSNRALRPSEAERALQDQLRTGRVDEGSDIETSTTATDYRHTSAASHAGKCYFTRIPGLIKARGLTPEELTAFNMDKSEALEQLLRNQYGGDEEFMLGEYQFAFLAFLLGHSIDGFLQWKRFLILMLGCENAVMGARRELFATFLKCLYDQLSFCLEVQMPGTCDMSQECKKNTCGEALSEQLLEDTFLKKAIMEFLGWVLSEQCLLNSEAYQNSKKIGRLLRQRLRWDCDFVSELPDGAICLSGQSESMFRSSNRNWRVVAE